MFQSLSKTFFLFTAFITVVVIAVISSTTHIATSEKNDNSVTLDTYFWVGTTPELSVEKIINTQTFSKTDNQFSLDTFTQQSLIQLTITNHSNTTQQRILHNNLAYLYQKIDMYTYSNDKNLETVSVNLDDPKNSKLLVGSSLLYKISLEPHEVQTIYIQNQSVFSNLYSFVLYSENASQQALTNKNFGSNIIVMMLLTLALYSLVLYLFGEPVGFLIYTLYLANAALGLFYLYGGFAQNFNVHSLQVHWLNITSILVPLFLAFYVKYILQTKRFHPLSNQLLNSVIILSALDALIAITFDLTLALQLSALIFFFSFAVLIFISVKYYQQKHPLINIFISAYTIYIIGILITLLSFHGFITFNSYTLHASGVGIVIEAFLFSYLLRYKSLLLEQEVAQHQNNEERLSYLAHHDPLTKLANRRLFFDATQEALETAKESKKEFALLFIDINGFKAVNDNYGHEVGDKLLQQIANRMEASLHNEEFLARFGGDEFIILKQNITNLEEVNATVKMLIQEVSNPYLIDNIRIKTGASIGVSFYPKDGMGIQELIQKADQAMYAVKNS